MCPLLLEHFTLRECISGVSALARREAGLQTGDILFIANILTTTVLVYMYIYCQLWRAGPGYVMTFPVGK